jgi:phosphoglycerate kinase
MGWRTLDDMDLAGKVVLTRVDLNVPVKDGRVSDATRIERIAPTIRDIIAGGGKPVLLAHFGRPKGKPNPDMSLRVVVPALEAALGVRVRFAGDCVGAEAETAVGALGAGEALLLENTRFHAEEEANDPDFAQAMAALGDVFCNDAFSAAHRAHASTEGLAHLLPSCAGRQMQAELKALEAALGDPERPLLAVVGGAKVSTKIAVLDNLIPKVQTLVIGGAMANTFLAAQGREVGKSLVEREMVDEARGILERARASACDIVLPVDLAVAERFEAGAERRVVAADACPDDMMILDLGPATVERIAAKLGEARTAVWNGPLGAFEIPPFDEATVAAARRAGELTRAGRLTSVAGGGDTVAALNAAGAAADFSYVSTAGGAFLEWLEGRELPGVAALGGRNG